MTKWRYIIILVLLSNSLFSQTTFQYSYGGTSLDYLWDLEITNDQGYIMVGTSSSFGSTTSNNTCIIKTDSYGSQQWNKVYDGVSNGSGYSIRETTSGNYIIVGTSSPTASSPADAQISMIDNSGALLWAKTYGGFRNDNIISIIECPNGDFLAVGSSSSFGNGPSDFDIMLLRVTSQGNTVWSRRYGGMASDEPCAIIKTSDENYLISGYTNSYGAGQSDAMLIKIDDSGNVIWSNTYGGIESDVLNDVIETTNGDFMLLGTTYSYGTFSNDGDVYVIKTNKSGQILWSKTYGGAGTDRGKSIVQKDDNKYIIVGETWSFGTAYNDVYLLEVDSVGILNWSNTYGNNKHEYGNSVHITHDNYIVVGAQSSSFGSGNSDYYLIKTDSIGGNQCNTNVAQTSISSANTISSSILISDTNITISQNNVNINPVSGVVTTPICSPLSTSTNSGNHTGIKVYPNPAHDFLLVQVPLQANADFQIKILNNIGQTVVQSNSRVGRLDVSQLPFGLYVVNVQTRNWSHSLKFVKE